MVLKYILITVYILQCISITIGQTVQSMPPQDSCVPQSVSLRCPPNFVVIVKTAFYGVSQTVGSCTYAKGDCIVDTISIVACSTDAVQCLIYASRRKLSQCNDQYNNYIHLEYDCVPLSMTDSSKEYGVCQNGTEITSENGIIRSPGYPTQFQVTTTECFRAIHVPRNKTIRLWLTDLYIGSTAANCAKDHVYVVDSVETHRHCGLRRYAYPYLCSSTILIQYLAQTNLGIYRGMRMYFEIVDRPADDGCPDPDGALTTVPSTTTPLITTTDPDVTTTKSTFEVLQIASPIRNFQLCKGRSQAIECPNNYGIAIVTNIFGVTDSGQCEPHDTAKHCVITTDPTITCLQRCTYMYSGNRLVPTCGNKIADYQYVEYQCIPTNSVILSPNSSCPSDGSKRTIHIDRQGRFQNYNYPTFQKMNCTYRLTTKPGYILRIYSLDVSLNSYSPICGPNKITFAEDAEAQGTDFCEQRSYSLIYSSCSNELDLRYIVGDDTQFFSFGAKLYIESQERPSDWACGKPLSTSSAPSTIPPTPFTTRTVPPLLNETSMLARDEIEHDICFNSALTYSCPTGYTFIILDAFYGVKKQASNKCGFVQGDCTQEALSVITNCRNDAASCYLPYSTKRRLAHCLDNYADYLHITSQCIPSKSAGPTQNVTTTDICESNDNIDLFNGILISPNFPSYRQTNNECRRTLRGIFDRILKVWINEMAVSSGVQRITNEHFNEPDVVIRKNHVIDDLDELEKMYPSVRETCVNDYLIINAPHVAYVYCGTRKLAVSPICAASVVIQYKSTSPPNLFYKGFKMYYEWVDKPQEVLCGGAIDSTTTPVNVPVPLWAQNLELSPILSVHLCLGSSTTLRCPRGSDYVLSIISAYYGVTGTGMCEIPASSHCYQSVSLDLACTQSCFIEYDVPKKLSQCQSKDADYLSIDYECIPTRLPNNENPIDICAPSTTDTIALNSGMMVSPQYPVLGAARTCSRKIETLPSKLWMIFIVDLFLEGKNNAGDCNEASLTIYDGNDRLVFCGLERPELALISCSNVVRFDFVSTHQALGYRGFKVFFQTVDVPSGWACVPSGFTTTTSTTTVRPPTSTTLLPPSFQIAATGGTTNGTRQYCKFPFTYQGSSQSSCLKTDPPSSTPGQGGKGPWCSLTSNFDTDLQWGFCELGITDSTLYDICRSQNQQLRCPPGYLIDIITADYAAKPNGNTDPASCVYDRNDCFQSDAASIQNSCAGKTTCYAVHIARSLTSCQNRQSAYYHIDYTCVPNDVPDITTYNLCDSNRLPDNDTVRGYIVSPNFPSTAANLDCTFNLQTVKPHQDIHLYVLNMDLNAPPLFGQICDKDRLIITADNNVQETCGRSFTNFLLNTCHSSVSLQLVRKADAKGGGVKFYFEFRERPPHQTCIQLGTTTPRPSTLSPITTTTGLPPIYFPDPSPRLFKTLCYPDLSSLFGTNNVQCPRNYVMVVHRAFYGKGNRCDFTPGDCTTEADLVYRTCAGKQACAVSFINIVNLPECQNAIANYLFLEYQCLPTPEIIPNSAELCTVQLDSFGGASGLLKSPSYPSYTQTQCANVTLSSPTDANSVIYMYLLDLNIGSTDLNTGLCSSDYLSVSYQCNNQMYTQRYCGIRSTEILFSTCSPSDKIFASYSLTDQDSLSKRGFALLYHFMPKIPEITTTQKLTTLLTTTTKPPLPPGPGPLSTSTEPSSSCVQRAITLQCNTPGYGLIIHKVQLGVNANGDCNYSPTDCFEDRSGYYGTCGGLPSCYIFPPLIPVSACNKSQSSYLYTEHQCIPKSPKLNLDVCSSGTLPERVEGGALISSLNYTSTFQQCKVQLQSVKPLGNQDHRAFKIFILSLNLPKRPKARDQGAQCDENDPLVEIDDLGTSVTRLCGNSHARYLLETCSDTIEIRFKNVNIGTSFAKFKGFEIYVESVQNDQCRPTISPPIETQPLVVTKATACQLTSGKERVDFSCTADHGLVFLQSYHFVTKSPDQCDVSENTCFYPSEQPQGQCSGQRSCSFIHSSSILPQVNPCANSRVDSTEFYYQCLPMTPSSTYPKFTLGQQAVTTGTQGFIETPNYPNTYQNGQQTFSIRIPLPESTDERKYSVYLYVIDLSIRDTSIVSPSTPVECLDSIKYIDGSIAQDLCGKIDQPLLQYYTKSTELTLSLNISSAVSLGDVSNWQGARFFFHIGDQSLPSPPSLPTTTMPATTTSTTTEPKVEETSTRPAKKPNHGGTIAAIIISILVVLAGVIGFVFYRRRSATSAAHKATVVYAADKDSAAASLTNGVNEKRSSVPVASLRGLGSSTITSPFYKKPDTTGTQGTGNAADT